MTSLYKIVTENKPPEWLGNAGDKAYEGMDNALKAIGKKLKKKKKKDEPKVNAFDLE